MKGKYTLQILKAIGDVAMNTKDILQVVLEHPNKKDLIIDARRNLDIVWDKRQKNRAIREEYFLRIRRYHNLVAWLKRDNLIKEIVVKNQKCLQMTSKGKKYLEILRKREAEELPKPSYIKGKENRTIIVAFDIPEREKKKRAWLREALTNIHFHMAQKSVWIGRTQIPGELLQDLRRMHVLEFVEIFAVTKKGSLRNLKRKTKQQFQQQRN